MKNKEMILGVTEKSGVLNKNLICCGKKMYEDFRNLIHETNNGRLRIYNVVYICLVCGRFHGVNEEERR